MVLELITIIICLCLNAFFSAYEMAFVTVKSIDLQELIETESKFSQKLRFYKSQPERTLSIIQIGISLVGAIAAAVGGAGAVEHLVPIFVKRFNMAPLMAEALTVALVIIPLTYASVVFGELLPKSIALKHPKKILKVGTRVLNIIDDFLYPVVTFLQFSTNFFLKRFDFSPESSESSEEMVDIGQLPHYHKNFVKNLLALKFRPLKKVLLPWKDVSFLNFTDSTEEVRMKTLKSSHSRFPVLDEDMIVGYLHVKELNSSLASGDPWDTLIRPIMTVQDNEKALEVFMKMQKKRQHISGVLNDQEKLIGIITLEDILEEIVGDIEEDISADTMIRLLSKRRRMNFNGNQVPPP